jgi:hypothetical protein
MESHVSLLAPQTNNGILSLIVFLLLANGDDDETATKAKKPLLKLSVHL